MTLNIRRAEIADRIGDVLDILHDDTASPDEWAAAYAIAQQMRLRLDRSLKARRDDLIVHMEREGLRAMGPLSVKSSAVDPSYPCNSRDNWEDATTQEAMAGMLEDPITRPYIRRIPYHLEVAVDVLSEDVRLGVDAALVLYRELNRRGWRREEARRLSLAVREPKGITP